MKFWRAPPLAITFKILTFAINTYKNESRREPEENLLNHSLIIVQQGTRQQKTIIP